MHLQDVIESSPLTFKGSITTDLLQSKLWICQRLKSLGRDDFSTIYILGSWYGNMAYVLYRCGVEYEKIINVDINPKWLNFSTKLLRRVGIDNIEPMAKDANDLNYRQCDQDSMVINTSVPDMEDAGWFDNIPKGTLVVLQDRDHQEDGSGAEDFFDRFEFTKILYKGTKHLKDPETKYQRFMIIGIK